MYIDEAIEKILMVSKMLDQQLKNNPQDRKSIATMYYLASQRIKYAFGKPIATWREGQRETYSLSGFKKPLNYLFDQLEDGVFPENEKIRGSLVFLSHHFDYRISEILNEEINSKLYLSSQAQVRITAPAEYGNFLRDFY